LRGGRVRYREFAEAAGELSADEYVRFLIDSLSLAAKYSRQGSLHFVCNDWRHIGEVVAAGREIYRELKNVAVWVKTNPGQGSLYRSQHELVFVFQCGEGNHINNVQLGRHGRNRSNVWTYPGTTSFRRGRVEDLSVHPTVKPVALVADAMRDCSRRGDVVLDPFAGSGTSILAAERIGRRGYGLEIEPRFVDAAVHRWQNYTRRDAILEPTGETFADVAADRQRRSP
jgi:DNA modification methylase